MKSINPYYDRQLTQEEILAGEHRTLTGGLWSEIGRLQLQFLQQNGLLPDHRLLDIGCGALRCGIPIIEYLDTGNYYGLDLNASLVEAGKRELEQKELISKQPYLLVNDKFEFDRFGKTFDFAIGQSLFTHLDMNLIVRCLVQARKLLKPAGRFFATFFLAPFPGHLATIKHQPGGIITNFDADPFHYSFCEMEWLTGIAGLSAKLIGDWNHPRNQKMIELSTKMKDVGAGNPPAKGS
jgi:SAM-dependent methyltransferase